MTVTASLPHVPALVRGRVTHQRRGPLRHGFSGRHPLWLVDIDADFLPRWASWLGTWRARDHLSGGRHGNLRDDLRAELAVHGIHLEPEDRVLMLASPRALGYVFNPLTLWWCVSPSGHLKAVLAEVHNTYGGRHVYALNPSGSTPVDKEFYVSPFHPVEGSYRITHRLTPDQVLVTITYTHGDQPAFTASYSGAPAHVAPSQVLWAAARTAATSWRTMAAIRAHGIYLWARGLRVVPRPASLKGAS